MKMYEETNNGSGLGNLLLLLVIVGGLGYLFVKKMLPCINQKLDTDYKWYHIPLAIGAALLAIVGLYWSSESNKRSTNSDLMNRLNKLSNEELMRIVDSGNDMAERNAARTIMEMRIKRRKDMINK
jgi:UDP-N-acetylglucosamine:LPS N-acetylglucosamine transferase